MQRQRLIPYLFRYYVNFYCIFRPEPDAPVVDYLDALDL